ncbi:MAG: hypothetical protein VYA71_05980 [Pseudomonadota bacterium]|nr:hypothetical protein [Pseudomonadota bacterium]
MTGEVIDSWCYLTEIIYPLGTAHHQCAIWCAAGGIPVGILDDQGKVYIVLSFGDNHISVVSPDVLDIQTHRITVEGYAFERDGLAYLMVDPLISDGGIVNLTHDDYGIQPFGK